METIENKVWLHKLNRLNSTVFMPAIFFTFIFFNTVVNLWMNERVETLQNVLVIVVIGVVSINFLSSPRKVLVPWIKDNYFVIGYLVVRAISFVNSGFDYSVARTIFFEVFFLVGISKISIDKKTIKNIYIYAFIVIELILTSACLVIYYIGDKLSDATITFLNDYTYYLKTNTTAMFSNPNTAGIMAAFAIILILMIYDKSWRRRNKVLTGIFIIYNVFFLITQSTRSAEIGLVAVALAGIFKISFKKVSKKTVCYLALTGCLIFVAIVYSFAQYNIGIDPKNNNEIENKINSISSNRYAIWKGCIMEQKDHQMFGAGNLALEEENRAKKFTLWRGYAYEIKRGSEFGPHNGYIGMISGAGWLGFLLFMAILIQRIRRGKIFNKGNWYLIIVFILAINLFESLFILNRFFTCFYLFLILEMDEEDSQLMEGEI